MRNRFLPEREEHPFHLVNPSPWPVAVGVSSLNTALGFVMWLHGYQDAGSWLLLDVASLGYFIYRWLRDIVTEAAYQGHHTRKVVQNLKYGMILFIVSEVMLFFSFFVAFFYYCTNPSIWVGCVWPPKGVVALQPATFALGNTVLLLSSSISATWAHYAIIAGNRSSFLRGTALTIFFAVLFLGFQYTEYKYAPFHINDSVYGSIFFIITGFHGFHVFIGTGFMFICLCRAVDINQTTFTQEYHFGFVACLWYWHFVDVIWLVVFFLLYVWGSWLGWLPLCRTVAPWLLNFVYKGHLSFSKFFSPIKVVPLFLSFLVKIVSQEVHSYSG
jgi:heme/copper-type cytochrome/quinol oxidase subunit 3